MCTGIFSAATGYGYSETEGLLTTSFVPLRPPHSQRRRCALIDACSIVSTSLLFLPFRFDFCLMNCLHYILVKQPSAGTLFYPCRDVLPPVRVPHSWGPSNCCYFTFRAKGKFGGCVITCVRDSSSANGSMLNTHTNHAKTGHVLDPLETVAGPTDESHLRRLALRTCCQTAADSEKAFGQQ